MERHAPIRDIGVVESRLERLVLHQHALISGEGRVRGSQAVDEPVPPFADILCTRIVRTVGEPQRQIAAAQAARDFHAIENVLERRLPDLRIRVSERPIFVHLVLKRVRIDGAGAQPVLSG